MLLIVVTILVVGTAGRVALTATGTRNRQATLERSYNLSYIPEIVTINKNICYFNSLFRNYETEYNNIKDFETAVIATALAVSVPKSTVGLSFEGFKRVNRSRDLARDMVEDIRLSDKYQTRGLDSPPLGGIYTVIYSGSRGCFVPNLSHQVESKVFSPQFYPFASAPGNAETVARKTWAGLYDGLGNFHNRVLPHSLW